MKFSTNLRNLRLQRGLTQMELAERLQTSQSAITAWESERREPDFKTIKRIADFFGVPITTLLPSSDDVDDDYVRNIAEAFHANQKLSMLFNKLIFFSESDLDAVISIVNAIAKEYVHNG